MNTPYREDLMNQDDEVLDGPRTLAEVAVETRLIYEKLKTIGVGEVVTYDELTAICGRAVDKEARGLLETARRWCLKEHQMVFGAQRGVGMVRLSDTQIVHGADQDIVKVRRHAQRGMAKLACASYENLSDEMKPEFNAKAAILGTLIQHSNPAQIKQVQKTYAEMKISLPNLKRG